MGLDPILEKLRVEFGRNVDCEAHVVYVLVELGKALEHSHLKTAYPTIMLYRNWAAHTKIELSDLADEMVHMFDDYIASGNASVPARLEALLKPETLRQEIVGYLGPLGFDLVICEDRIRWKRFVKHLAEVIDETPLQGLSPRRGKQSTPTKYVRSLEVKRTRNNESGRATLTWIAKCHTPAPAGVETEIRVVLSTEADEISVSASQDQDLCVQH